MERSIRIGKDFNVLWSIHKVVDGERLPYELAGKELELQYRTPYGIKKATEWVAEGNTIIWTFRGKEQKALGLYGLILTENGGKDGMVTVDTCKAFKLVAHSCEETEGRGNDVVIDVVVLESEVAFAPVATGGGGGSYDDTAIKEDIAELQENDRQIVEALVQFGEAVQTLEKNDQTIGESIAALQEKDEEIKTGLAQLGEKVAELEESGTGGGTSPSFTSVEVSVDDTTGDPKAEAEIDGNTLKIDFFGLKGEQGPQGPAGEKGADGTPGITSAEVSVDNTSGIPSVSATLEDKVLTLNFTGLKGEQGNSGYQGAVDELEVVNNLTDGGEAAALSAEMGKQLKQEIDVIYGGSHSKDIDSESLDKINGYIVFTTGVFTAQYNNEGNWVYLIPKSVFANASRITVVTKSFNIEPASVAFYTTAAILAEGYIKDKSVCATGRGEFTYKDVPIPAEANLIAITFAISTTVGAISRPSIVLGIVNAESLFIPRESITQSLGESKDMVPSQYAVTNILGKEDVDLYPSANKMRGYVKYTTGEFIGNDLYINNMSFIIPNNGYNRILVKTTSADNVPAAIAFYNTDTIDVNGYLSDYSVRARMGLRCHNSAEYDVLVPKEAKIIVVHGYGFSVSEVVPEIISIGDTSKYISYDKVSKQIAENNDSVVSSSAIAAALKGECLQNLPLGSAEISKGYISYLTGELTDPHNPNPYNYVLKYDVSNLQGAKMKISTAAYDNVPAAVSFFSSNEISSASYIAGLVAKEGISNYEVVIPNNAVIMAVTWASGLSRGKIYPAPIIEKYFDYGFIRKDEAVNRESTDIRLPQLRVTSSFLTIAGDQISGLTTNKNEVAVNYSFISKGHCFTDTGRIAYQGNSTIHHTKKGFSIDFDNKHRFGDWLEFDGFHCKAYFTDWMHFRDIACNKIYEYMMQSRPASHRRPYMAYNDFSASDIDMLADTGRLCHIDGFPVELYINDVYWGLYSINIKKHRDNYKLSKNNEQHIMLDPDNTFVNASLNWQAMEVRNPKNITNADGSEYNGDAPKEIADGAVKTAIMRLMNFFSSVGSATTKETFAEYLNLEEAVDDILLAKFICNWDFGGKNTLYTTWDGMHWSMLNYDNDATFGIFEDVEGYPFGDVVVEPSFEPFSKKAYSFCPWLSRLEAVLSADLEARYAELRNKGVFSKSNVENLCKEWMHKIGPDVFADDTARWSYPGLGNAKSSGRNENFIDSVPRLLTWVEQRIAVLDEKYNYSSN